MSRQLFRRLRRCACLLTVAVGACWARADEPKDKPAAPTASQPTTLQIAQWIKDLDSDDFQVRQQASGRLIAAGRQAAVQVAKAAEGESVEVTVRCLDILSKLLRSPDADTKAEAKKALEGLAKSKNAVAARQAERLLDPSKPTSGEAPRDALGAIPLPPGRIEIGGIGIAGPGMRISVKSTDGNKTIEAEEGGKKTKIEETAKGEIKMEITETVDGKEKTSKVEAKSAEELKKFPEAHKLYERYSKFAPGVAIRIGGIPPGGVFPAVPLPAAPGFAPGMPIRIGAVPQKALDQIEEAKKQLADAADKLRKLAEESRITPEAVKKLADQIDTAKKQLEEARAMLPR
jgi:hypothetical protein